MMDEIMAEMELVRNRRHTKAQKEEYVHGLPKLMKKVNRGKKIKAALLNAKRKMKCVEAKFRESLEEKAFNEMFLPQRRKINRTAKIGSVSSGAVISSYGTLFNFGEAARRRPAIGCMADVMPMELLQAVELQKVCDLMQAAAG
ncbi:MAG: hypothetical protein WCJ59_01150 [bacterium]